MTFRFWSVFERWKAYKLWYAYHCISNIAIKLHTIFGYLVVIEFIP